MSLNQRQYDFVYKILIIGNSSVGKSSMLTRYVDNIFSQGFLPTIGVDFKIKTLQTQGSKIKLQIWDTAGQQKFRSILTSYYKGVHGVFIVFDITDRKSYEDTLGWYAQIQKNGRQDCVKFLIGNKIDLSSQRQVSYEQANKFAQGLGMKYIEVSSKDGKNIQKSFIQIIKQMKISIIAPKYNQYTKNPPVCLMDKTSIRSGRNYTCC